MNRHAGMMSLFSLNSLAWLCVAIIVPGLLGMVPRSVNMNSTQDALPRAFSRDVLVAQTESPEDHSVESYESTQEACSRGDPVACAKLGAFAFQRELTPDETIQAVLQISRGCDAGYYMACYNIGRLMEFGQTHVPPLPERAPKYYALACERGRIGDACHRAGINLYARARGNAESLREAARFFSIGCEEHQMESCASIGVLYFEGTGVGQDYAKAFEYYEKACDGGNAQGCNNLAFIYKKGLGVPPDEGKAKFFFDKSCRQGNSAACGYKIEEKPKQ